MSAYLIFTRERMRDPVGFESYNKAARLTAEGHKVEPIVFNGACETLEGADVGGVVILKFPSMEAGKFWYNSESYQKVRDQRLLSADYRVILTEGL